MTTQLLAGMDRAYNGFLTFCLEQRLSMKIFPVTMLTIAVSMQSNLASAQAFSGSFEFRWLSEPQNQHRIMQLLSEVSFTDKSGKVWKVPAGTNIDGASIPPVLWTFAGSPFTGNYRRASVIHDHYCTLTVEPTSAIHKMFRDAMEADGVGWLERQSKYLAVSAYSMTGGGCGRGERSIDLVVGSDTLSGILKSDELFARLEAFDTAADNGGNLEARVEEVTAIANVKHPLTFAALTEFRRLPSDRNFQALETAVRAEQPTDLEAEALAIIANATVPEGSLALPTK